MCLFNNTLVCLPTGLGKTFIAAIVILNYYLWFPEGHIFFLAPTKPLVNQQIECLSELDAIRKNDIVELTGNDSTQKRIMYYQKKKIFFMTPQTLENDLDDNRYSGSKISLIIFGTSFAQPAFLPQTHLTGKRQPTASARREGRRRKTKQNQPPSAL